MNKLMSRYKGLILSCVSMMMIVVCVCSFSLTSHAEESAYKFNKTFAEPSTSDTQGYITLFWKKNSNYYTSTFFWNCYAVVDGVESPCYASIDVTKQSFSFTVGGATGYDNFSAIYSLYYIDEWDHYEFVRRSSESTYYWNMNESNGITILGWQAKGNIGKVTSSIENQDFDVYYNTDSSAVLLQAILQQLMKSNNMTDTIEASILYILHSVDGVESRLDAIEQYLRETLPDIDNKLLELLDKADALLNEEQKQTSWLEKIWNSIQEFVSPSEEDEEAMEEFESETTEKSDTLDGLNEQNKTDKVDIGNASGSVDANIDLDSISNYGIVLSTITENEYILQILLLVFSVALVSYVLFGKR